MSATAWFWVGIGAGVILLTVGYVLGRWRQQDLDQRRYEEWYHGKR